ncbi:MAG: NAD-dependent DNA ligase LigA [Bacteroidia bacterium]|nr:NAD-dependent DNA ligase LigA [Bacteroidia bacterium]MCF8446354.1 NAD-dependent DNA ligase LigA [Bacteroidia bacterium]
MNLEEAKKQIDTLSAELKQHNYNYYILSQPSISDFDFDQKLKELEALEKEFPVFLYPNSPTQKVGGDITKNFQQVKHRYPMLSLGNTYSEEELLEFDERVRKSIGNEFTYVCELKFDGLAISITYENGKLVRAVTRGDGVQGDDVTNNVKTIRSIPHELTGNFPAIFDIRGEIFMHRKTFDRLNNNLRKELIEQGVDEDKIAERLYKNPRNFASGSLKMQDSKEVAKRSLDAFLYFVYSDQNVAETHAESLQMASSWGFQVSDHFKVCQNMQEVMAFINRYNKDRNQLSYDIDGVVIKVNEYKHQEDLGFTAKVPRWAISYKYKAETAISKLREVTYQVGRTGAITPVANIVPVQLAGTTVKRASLYNADELERLDLYDHDTVFVEKGGEIIPKITGVDKSKRDLFATKIVYPTHCPECGTALVRKEGEAIHYCPNDSHCTPQLIGRMEHFISRRAMNIEGLGSETVAGLFKKGLIQSYADLYSLTYEQLNGLEFESEDEAGNKKKRSIKEKGAENIIKGIEASKQVPFERVLFALGIRMVGETVAKKLAQHFETLDAIIAASPEQIANVYEIGEKIAENLIRFFADTDNVELVKRLQSLGLKMAMEFDPNESRSQLLAGKSFLVSGSFSISRDELKKLIENNGGRNVGSISKTLDYLIAGDKMGPEKLKKATDLNIKMISEEEFKAMLNH